MVIGKNHKVRMPTHYQSLTNEVLLSVAANALIITIIIAIILSILSSALILLTYYNRQIQVNSYMVERRDRNLSSGISIALSDTTAGIDEDDKWVDLGNKGEDSVRVLTKNWGVYRVGVVQSVISHKFYIKTFLFGNTTPGFYDGCIYLIDHSLPLSISGKTNLTGDAYLPKEGLKAAYIEQRSYDRNSLINGKILYSLKSPPQIDTRWLKYFDSLLQNPIAKAEISSDFFVWQDKTVSFADSLVDIGSSGKIELGDVQIKGNILLQSDSSIIVNSDCKLENILMVAPVVRIKTGFKGALQIIAADSIIVEPDCTLEYPSSLVLIKKTGKLDQSDLIIGKRCSITGCIISYTGTKDINKTLVSIDDSTLINGIVYVNGYLSLKGSVYGSVLTDYFLYKTNNSTYQNILMDVNINRQMISRFYVGPSLFLGRGKTKLIEWVK
jgi:hypothetical protein